MGGLLAGRFLSIKSVPPRVLFVTLVASVAGQLLGGLQGWPLWGIVLASLIPWIPVLTSEMAWMYRHYQWLALFYLLVLTQAGHFMEHAMQMVQIHLLDQPPAESHGIFGALDIEWVHFIWNTWILVAVTLLLYRFGRNPWLWATLLVALWHEVEHTYIMVDYLDTGQQGTPGLLAEGGALGGGLGIIRPDLHFWYNVIETAPLIGAFVYQLKHSYDEWLHRALPRLSEDLLIETTNVLETKRFGPGDTVVKQGELADRFFIVVSGELEVIRENDDGPVVLRTMAPGQFFGEIGLLTSAPRTASVRAKTTVECLCMDRQSFESIVQRSEATAEDIALIAQERLATG